MVSHSHMTLYESHNYPVANKHSSANEEMVTIYGYLSSSEKHLSILWVKKEKKSKDSSEE